MISTNLLEIIMNKTGLDHIRTGEAMAGIGAWSRSLKYLDIPHKLQWFYEIDKYAINAFCAIHGVDESLNKGDIFGSKDVEDIDGFYYSPPCQSFSVAGKREGTDVAKGTIFWECLELIKEKKPFYAIMENVRGLTDQAFSNEWATMQRDLIESGYINYPMLLNTKNFGVPQNRSRIFLVSIRADIDKEMKNLGIHMTEPQPFKLELRLKDLLEDKVDEKYYLSDKIVEGFIQNENKEYIKEDVGVAQVGNIVTTGNFDNPQRGRIYSSEGVSPSLNCVGGGGLEPKIIEPETPKRTVYVEEVGTNRTYKHVYDKSFNITEDDVRYMWTDGNFSCDCNRVDFLGYKNEFECGEAIKVKVYLDGKLIVDESKNMEEPKIVCLNPKDENGKQPSLNDRIYDSDGVSFAITTNPFFMGNITESIIAASRGRGENNEQNLEFNSEGTTNTITSVAKDNYVVEPQLRIRKLTPLECFRLQHFSDDDYYRAVEGYEKKWGAGKSDSQMYARAGNSISVNVINEIHKNLLLGRQQVAYQSTMFDYLEV